MRLYEPYEPNALVSASLKAHAGGSGSGSLTRFYEPYEPKTLVSGSLKAHAGGSRVWQVEGG